MWEDKLIHVCYKHLDDAKKHLKKEKFRIINIVKFNKKSHCDYENCNNEIEWELYGFKIPKKS